MIKLVLVRHGQSVWNLENRFTGWTDVELSNNGIKEAKEAVDSAPKTLKEAVSKEEAEDIKAKLEAEGAKVTVK